jgi:signal peptidase I
MMTAEVDSEKPRGSEVWDIVKVVIHALILAGIVRIFLFQPFNIPSGSMMGTLLVGDYLFVSKYSYGYSRYSFPFGMLGFSGRVWSGEPERGDIAVFRLPTDTSIDYIKRVIGLPGDEIQMRNGILHINGTAVPKRRVEDFVGTNGSGRETTVPRFEETLPNGVKYFVLDGNPNGFADNTAVYKVPPGSYFMMGDNRDNSTDSRFTSEVGPVPLENFVGRAQIIFYSIDERSSWWRFWEWPFYIRWSRLFDLTR